VWGVETVHPEIIGPARLRPSKETPLAPRVSCPQSTPIGRHLQRISPLRAGWPVPGGGQFRDAAATSPSSTGKLPCLRK
jgi:hypothetical protein